VYEWKLSSGKRKVRSRKQEKAFYCGPAVAQMTLGGLGVSRTQNGLWDSIQDEFQNQGLAECEPCPPVPCSPWATRPEALRAVMDRLTKVPIKLVSNSSVAPTDHAIVWSVTNDVAACVLVQGWRHWVVVYGYKADRVPANAADTGYVLNGFHVRDPAQSEPATRYVTAAHWRNTYLTGVPCGTFTGKFVAVCDPDDPLPEGGPTVAKTSRSEGTFLTLARAARVAQQGIAAAGLLEDPVWRAALRQANAGTPLLVHRLDRLQSFYYLVPFKRRRTVTVQALVDPGSGEFLEAQAGDDGKRSLPLAAAPSVVMDLVSRRRLDVVGWRRHALLRREGLSVSSTLVWKPCQESLSPYLPFTMVTYGDRQIYVRADGEVFTALTEATPGN
jgi:hypothetical protein